MQTKVINVPLLRIPKRLVGFQELLRLLLGIGSATCHSTSALQLIIVRMDLHDQHTECTLDLLLARRPVDTQNLIVIRLVRAGFPRRLALLRLLLELLRDELLVLLRVALVADVEELPDAIETLQ